MNPFALRDTRRVAADLLERMAAAWLLSLLAVHASFGLTHAYQGLAGLIDGKLKGILLCMMTSVQGAI